LTKKNQKFAQLKSVLTLIKEPEDACFLIPYAVVKERLIPSPDRSQEKYRFLWWR